MHLEHSHHHHHDHEHDAEHGHGHEHHLPGSPEGPGAPWLFADRRLLWLCLALIAMVAGYSSCFVVDQSEFAFVTSFGHRVRLYTEPGLKFKLPYHAVHRFDARLQTVNPPGSQMLTRNATPEVDGAAAAQSLGGSPLTVEWYACWRLPPSEESLVRFWRSVGTVPVANNRLAERIDAVLRSEVGRMSLAQFVKLDDSNADLQQLHQVLQREVAKMSSEQFGIELVDVRIKRFNHPEGVKESIFEMIRAERKRVAERLRSEGKSEAVRIRSEADKLKSQMLSRANAEAARIRGQGAAEAIAIANEAHRADPEFYRLTKTLETYRAILNEQTTVVLSAESELMKLLTSGTPAGTPPRPATTKDSQPASHPDSGSGMP